MPSRSACSPRTRTRECNAAGVSEAVERAIAKATEALRHLDWFEVVAVRGPIGDDGRVAHHQATVKIGSRLED